MSNEEIPFRLGFAVVAKDSTSYGINHVNVELSMDKERRPTGVALSGAWRIELSELDVALSLTQDRQIIACTANDVTELVRGLRVVDIRLWKLLAMKELEELNQAFEHFKSQDKRRVNLKAIEISDSRLNEFSEDLPSEAVLAAVKYSHHVKRVLEVWYEIESERMRRPVLLINQPNFRFFPVSDHESDPISSGKLF